MAVHPARIRRLNEQPERQRDYVLYWMQASQRAEHNDALEHALARANELRQPLVTVFGLTEDYPEANARHYRFMLEGLADAQQAMRRRGLQLVVRQGSPDSVALELARDASLIVCDGGYLRHQRRWRQQLARRAEVAVDEVEADVIVPVRQASPKSEYTAATFRSKLRRQLESFLTELQPEPVKHPSSGLDLPGLELEDPAGTSSSLKVDQDVPAVPLARGGTSEAERVFERFIVERLPTYSAHRRRPETDNVSFMSRYLHFGQVSPVWLYLRASRSEAPEEDLGGFLDELLVRRELCFNFIARHDDYDRYESLPGWARKSLEQHAGDERSHGYSLEELEQGKTDDPYWNAAMLEMRSTGYMHNYMRMYWGKMILSWVDSPERAHRTALYLNNRYFIDGRDANSYANVGWIFGLHDRPWAERPVFGKVRIMTASGLRRKADPDAYVDKVQRLAEQVSRST